MPQPPIFERRRGRPTLPAVLPTRQTVPAGALTPVEVPAVGQGRPAQRPPGRPRKEEQLFDAFRDAFLRRPAQFQRQALTSRPKPTPKAFF